MKTKTKTAHYSVKCHFLALGRKSIRQGIFEWLLVLLSAPHPQINETRNKGSILGIFAHTTLPSLQPCSPTRTVPGIRNKKFKGACCSAIPLAGDFLFINPTGLCPFPEITLLSISPSYPRTGWLAPWVSLTCPPAPRLACSVLPPGPSSLHASLQVLPYSCPSWFASLSARVLSVKRHQKSKRRLFPVTWFYKNRIHKKKMRPVVAFAHLVVTLIIDSWVWWAARLQGLRVASDKVCHSQLPLWRPCSLPSQRF